MTRESVVFPVCLLLAVLMLLLNKLSKNYPDTVNAKLVYVNLPKNKAPVVPLPNELTLHINTRGFNLVWEYFKNPVEVKVDLADVKTNFMLTSSLEQTVIDRLSPDYKLNKISPDTLFFRFDKGISKKVPVLPDIQISFKKQYDFMEPLFIKPDSVEITGPENIVAPLKGWKTQKIVFDNLGKNVQGELEMEKSSFVSVTINPGTVKYVIAVEEYTEKALDVDIEKINFPEKKEINIYPKKVRVVFRVGLSNFAKADEEAFGAVADFSDVALGKSKYVAVEIIQSPAFVRNLDYSPKSVEYIVYD